MLSSHCPASNIPTLNMLVLMMLRVAKTAARRLSGMTSASIELNPTPKKCAGAPIATSSATSTAPLLATPGNHGTRITSRKPNRWMNKLPSTHVLRRARRSRKRPAGMLISAASSAGSELSRPTCVFCAPRRTAKAALNAAATLIIEAHRISTHRFQALWSSVVSNLRRNKLLGQRLMLSQVGNGGNTTRNLRRFSGGGEFSDIANHDFKRPRARARGLLNCLKPTLSRLR